jgi:hypothetical protein
MSWEYLHLSPRVHMPLVKSKQMVAASELSEPLEGSRSLGLPDSELGSVVLRLALLVLLSRLPYPAQRGATTVNPLAPLVFGDRGPARTAPSPALSNEAVETCGVATGFCARHTKEGGM